MKMPTTPRLTMPRRLAARLIDRLRDRRRQRIDRGLFQAMDERELRDMGIGRGELEHWLHLPMPSEARRGPFV